MASALPAVRGGYQFLSRFRSHVEPDVFLAECDLEPIRGRHVLIEYAPRTRPDYPALESILYSEARSQPAFAHPNLTSVIDFFEDDEGLYLVLEHVEGSSLHTVNGLLRSRTYALDFDLAAYVTSEVLIGLHHLHTTARADGSAAGTILEQLFPERIRISNEGDVKLANTSLARVLARPENENTGPDRFGYFSVEWIAGEPLTAVSNVYTIGVMLFELLLGRSCFVGNRVEDILHQISNRGVRTRELFTNGVPRPLCSIVERATRLVPEQRYSSALEMSQALSDWLADRRSSDMRQTLARFLWSHGLKANIDPDAEPDTVEVLAENSPAASLFGLRKPAGRTVTKVGLRPRAK